MHHLGLTRSANRRDHLLLTPDTFIRTPLPGLTKGLAIVHVAPQAGAAFTMMTVELEAGGTLTEGPTQRFLYVLEGELTLKEPGSAEPHAMSAGGYAYLPTEYEYKLEAQTKARVAVIDKPFLPLTAAHGEEVDEPWPLFLIGREAEVASVPLNGDESLQVRSLLPDSLAFDFACNTMTYRAGCRTIAG